MTRIIAGSAKGRRLDVPSKGTRPTSDKVRGAIFSRLTGWSAVEGARVLDLFAGSGALALEALSRGAASAVCVEKSGGAAAVIRKNTRACDFEGRVEVVSGDVLGYLKRTCPSTSQTGTPVPREKQGRGFDLVFIDPPYSLEEEEVRDVLGALVPCLHIDATIVLERDARSPEPILPPEFELISSKRWGDTAAWYLSLAASEV